MPYKIKLDDAFKRFTLDQDKVLPPEETVSRFKEKLKALDHNILEQTMRIDTGRLDIPVYFSICADHATQIIGTKKQMGKGATPQQAEASAVMELAERYSFFSFYKNPQNFFIEKSRNIKHPALSFDMIAQSVHDTSDELEISKKIFEDLPLQWTWAYNLTREQEVVVPFNWFFSINEFNGPCAGNCVEEALSQGICEVVERHVSSIISHRKLNVPAINPDSATDPMVVDMINKYRNAGIKLFLSDFSLDTGIPTVGALAYDPVNFPEKSEIVWTAGTTPDPQKALSRALTETAQLAGDFNTGSNYVASGLPKFTKIEDANFITGAEKVIAIQQLPDLSNQNIKIEVQNCISALEKNAMEVIAVNTTHPVLGIPAFYIIIPGAHFRERAMDTSVGMFSAKIITENNRPEDAIRKLEKIDAMLTGKYYIKFYLGSSQLALNNLEAALTAFSQALALNPTEQDAASIYAYMGICYKEMGKYRQALDVLEHAEKYDNERTDIYNLMGFCYFMLKMHEKAISCFKKVLQLDPSSAIDYANIGSNYRDMGKKDKAIEYYETALALDPSIDFARDSLTKLQQ